MIYEDFVLIIYTCNHSDKMPGTNLKPPDLNPGPLNLETSDFQLDYDTPDNMPTYLNKYTFFMLPKKVVTMYMYVYVHFILESQHTQNAKFLNFLSIIKGTTVGSEASPLKINSD